MRDHRRSVGHGFAEIGSEETRVSRRDRYAGRRRGQSVAEMALVLPIVLLLFIGVLDFGRVFYAAIAISHGARAGVQYGAQNNPKSGDFAGMRQAATDALGDVSNLTVTACRYCRCADGTGSCASCPADNADLCATGSACLNSCPLDAPQVFVQVTVDKVFTTLFPYPGIPKTTDINRRAIIRVQ